MLITPREPAIGGQRRPIRLGGTPKSGFNGRMDQDLHRKNGWRENRRALLAAHPVLGFLSPRELDHVTGLMIPRRYRAGEVIFRKGEPGESMMVIASGQVKISMSGLDGKEAVLDLGKCDEGHCPPGARVELPISQKTFASLLGTSRETLNKQLHAWQSEGLIAIEPGAVVIFQPEALLRFAEE